MASSGDLTAQRMTNPRGSPSRLVVAAPASGHGKTTVATGLMAALRGAGHRVSGHKVGPDYIDPGYHELATALPGRNLDPHLVGEHRLVPLLRHGARVGGRPADIAVIEGVMGLFDGQIGADGFASTAHVARVTGSPVLLIVDISHASRSIAAVVQGMVSYDPAVRIGGVVLNKAGSARHAEEVRRSLAPLGIPVLGVLHRDDGVVAPSRHLGLVPAAERADAAASLDWLADRVTASVDLEAVIRLARSADPLSQREWSPSEAAASVGSLSSGALRDARPVVAVAGGRAFTFCYTETTELLEAAGCDVVVFDPLADEALPDGTSGIYLGGGFPEVHAAGLAANRPLLGALRGALAAGVPTVAECAGLLYLCRTVDGTPMVGAIEADAGMDRRLTLAYRTSTAVDDNVLTTSGTAVTGHEFHRTTTRPGAGRGAGDRSMAAAWMSDIGPEGFASATLHASYLHTHWAGHPGLGVRFAQHVAQYARSGDRQWVAGPDRAARSRRTSRETEPNRLVEGWRHHHGDAEMRAGLVDFAVNVYDGPRPDWLDRALSDSLADAVAYPDPTRAERVVARRHGRIPDEVLATAGAAEAFGLLARARSWRRPVVVHPQFTEPDAALAAAGYEVTHVFCDGPDFALVPERVPDDADLVVVGNPTNPTGTLHRSIMLRKLLRPGRVLVVDEAFMDTVPGERESFAGTPMPGLLVLRSLTKLWSIPGIRAGYVIGDPDVLADLRSQQPPWSVSTSATAALIACSSAVARPDAAARAASVARSRRVLLDGLAELGIPVVRDPATPFVLARPERGAHATLRAAGYAVRRGDTFPGLDDSWIRVAVRRPATTHKLLATMRAEGLVR